jgi:hypothetical protein
LREGGSWRWRTVLTADAPKLQSSSTTQGFISVTKVDIL